MTKYIAYCRKSTDEKDRQVLSIEAQIAELKEFAKREKLHIVETLVESKTAKEPGRLVFQQMMKLLESGKANAILSWHPDRLARNSVDGGQIIYLVDTGKIVDLKFPSFWFENTPQGKFMLNIAFGQSKYYVDNLSENVKRGNRQKLRNGVWPNKAPLGYKNIIENKSIAIDPKKAKVIKKAFELFADGKTSYAGITRFLFDNGIRSGKGKPLKIDKISQMFKKKFYIGTMEFNGEEFPASHPTFISKQLFEKVQERTQKLSRPREINHDFAFSGLMRCGECGAAITAEQHIKHYRRTNRTVKYIYYRCTKKIKPCSQPYLEENKLFGQLKNEIKSIALPKSWTGEWKTRLAEDKILSEQSREKVLALLHSQSESFDTKLNVLLDGYLDGTIESDIYKTKKNQLFQEKLKVENQISKTEESGSSWLEPFSQFVNCAILAQKIARKGSGVSDLRIFAQNIGSNFFLKYKQIIGEHKKPFASLRARAGARATTPKTGGESQSVDRLQKMSNFNVLARLAPLGSLAPARRPHPPRLRYFLRARFLLGYRRALLLSY